MPSIGPLELAIVLVIVLLIFGPKRLPGLGRQLGSGMREFKDSITGKDKDDADDTAQGAFGDDGPKRAEVSAPADATAAGEADEPAAVTSEPRTPDAPRSEG